MNDRPATVLILGATGSIGRHAVAEALKQGHGVRALVRDRARAARLLPDGVDLVTGELTRPETLGPAVEGVDAIVFTRTGPPPTNATCGTTTTPGSRTSSKPWVAVGHASRS